VPKSATSRRRRSASGSEERRNSTTSDWPCSSADVDADLVVRQIDDHAPGAVGTTAEVDVLQRDRTAVQGLGEPGLLRRSIRTGHALAARWRIEQNQQGLALQFGAVGGGLLQIQHEAGSFAGLRDVDRTQVALVNLYARLSRAVDDTRKVDRHPRRGLHREAVGHSRQRLGQFDAHDLEPRLLRARDRLDRVLRKRRQRGTEEHCERDDSCPPLSHHLLLLQAHHRAFSWSWSELVRSIHSPAAS
jgi:hypothetical protein